MNRRPLRAISTTCPAFSACLRLLRLGLGTSCLILSVFLSGCAGYRLGPVNQLYAREKTVQVRPFVNETLQPRLTDTVTAQLRKELQRDGTFALATHGEGDIIVSGSLTEYRRIEVTFSRNDILTGRDYRVTLTAKVTARDRASGNLLLNQPVTGQTLIRAGSDLASAERQAMPLLATDLARNVTSLLTEGKW